MSQICKFCGGTVADDEIRECTWCGEVLDEDIDFDAADFIDQQFFDYVNKKEEFHRKNRIIRKW